MPTCLECGFSADRLQWTHFKYKCTGRFNNCKEYLAAYPDAEIVSENLKKKCAVTLESLSNKYGGKEGKIRWDSYRRKQAETNTFEYKKKKYGWNEEQFSEYNKSRSTTFENFVKRYGEKDAIIKWQIYKERQGYTNTIKYFVEKYGDEEGRKRYEKICAKKAHTMQNVMRVHECTEDEAKKILSNRIERLKFTSNLEREIIYAIEESIGKKLNYSVLTKQYCVWGNNKANFYDIVHNNRAIEINGDYWHCNPAMFEHNYYHPHAQILAEDIWANDKNKIDLLLDERGIETLVIWESDYIHDPVNTIERCIKWIQ